VASQPLLQSSFGHFCQTRVSVTRSKFDIGPS
jgi:hypothetical protein